LNYENFEVVVVDNGSSDDSVATIRRNYPLTTILENKENLGYTGGNNIGIQYAMGNGADYVWLLNNDAVVDLDTLAKLVDEAERFPTIGLVSPVIYYYDNPDKIQFMGAYADFAKNVIANIEEPNELDNNWVQRYLVLWGTALFIKRNVIESIGYLSERYFAYWEDIDYSLRALRKHFQTKVRLDARILHKDSRSSGKQSPFQVFLKTRNHYFLWRDNLQGLKRIFALCHYIGMVIGAAKNQSDKGNEISFDACLNGAWAAFLGKGGAYDQTIVIPSWLKTVFRFFGSWHPYFWVCLFNGNFRGIVRRTLTWAQH